MVELPISSLCTSRFMSIFGGLLSFPICVYFLYERFRDGYRRKQSLSWWALFGALTHIFSLHISVYVNFRWSIELPNLCLFFVREISGWMQKKAAIFLVGIFRSPDSQSADISLCLLGTDHLCRKRLFPPLAGDMPSSSKRCKTCGVRSFAL